MSTDSGDPHDLATVGILGGMSSESTREYYRGIDEAIGDELGGHNAGDLVIRSVNFAEIERCIRTDQWDRAGDRLVDAALAIEAAGADFVVMATNTMHRVAPRLVEALSIPFVHIVDVAAEAIRADGLETIGVLGTAAVMEGAFYHDRFADHGIETLVPDADDREAVDRIIFEELTHGEVLADSRERYLELIDDLVARGAEGVVLGCTEIELLVSQTDRPEVPLYDTTALHVERAVERSLGEAPNGSS
ncbi:aspartate racemase [Halovivax ruber XH-70]|uniref:Aspartate racemase n=1 Tax=Halovivax ruber (strain DSM 18193 / JCM 13892 / XH-70) TaxID=797302 RepID=L0IF50_HALRX|nr:aspartate/glutamate racemase family protein [Halovivax ruber]AGB16821.1 aspartate racemase [Halovivax ruber XH-70]